ncbi:MAG: hypothetical protein U0V54_14905 [Saprospiraceae bacterium]|nr:hypothetical protein [Saprospiraceae bacterium]
MSKYYKSIITTSLILGIILFYIATLHYPGGSNWNKNSIGFDWRYNYITNLFNPIAVNGESNGSVPWAIGAMALLCIGFALFFVDTAQKINTPTSSRIIKWGGALSMLFAFLAVTPWHDLMVTMSNVLVMLSLFYITVHLFKSKLFVCGLLSAMCLSAIYLGSIMYYTQLWLDWLPVVQKIVFVLKMALILSLTWGPTNFR